ncbi:ATP-dependent RNA helicase [Streptomyces gamaensis]|uniref:ATP-dependent RNA helicase n=1 Tax=Streptomyces gamaensis TaxID=1763542 RepID=A0ABW0Z6U8_9ACTN
MIRTDALDRLPVRAVLPALTRALDGHGTAVLCAPPGTGKTTLVPLALAGLLTGGPAHRVLVAEPRRIAARAAARRMAWLLGEDVGDRVGFTVRGERRAGPRTAVEVVTTGVLLQRLQRDPELAGVGTVVLDECHERHLDADTAAAFLLDVRAALRPELRLLAASATTDAQGWARLLGGAPVVEAEGVSHPVQVVWAPPERPVRPPHGMRVDPALLAHVARVVRRALRERQGDVLCFLPGVGEIARVAGLLGGEKELGAQVLQVHGRAPAAVQDAALSGATGGTGATGGRRVVLATSVAESSLTVPGVRTVVDAGLAREPRTDHARGLSALTTVRASLATGRQRAGRAGREAPGTVYRCWAEADEARLPRFPAAEITVADLTAFALQAACWGDPDASGLALLDGPPSGAMAAARDTLSAIGAVDTTGRATDRGRRMTRLGLHPRLARALLDSTPELGARRAAEVVALLSEEPPREYGDDLAAAWRTARRGSDPYAARWRAEARRLESAVRAGARDAGDTDAPVTQGHGPLPAADGAGPGPGGYEQATRAMNNGRSGGSSETVRDAAGAGACADGNEPAAPDRQRPTADRDDSGPESASSTTAPDATGTEACADGGEPAVPGRRQPAADTAGSSPGGGSSGTARDAAGAKARTGVAAGGRVDGRGAAPGGGASQVAPADDAVVGLVAALAFPERVARRRGEGVYLMASGTGAELGGASRLRSAEWLAVAVADRPVAAASARVRLGAVIDEDTARAAAGALYTSGEEIAWSEERRDVVARETERLGAVELAARPLPSPDPGLVRAALCEGLRREGTGLLRWTPEAVALRQRLAFLRRELGDPWPETDDAALLARLDDWLGWELEGARRRADLERLDAGKALERLLPWATGDAARLDELAPERIEVPSGSRIRVDYGGGQPVLAVKLQELFGLRETPRIAGGRVPVLVHLLSPAGRPAAVTADLASFWGEGYRAVRAELRGRYPRHPWPEDPTTATPTRRTNARRQ